MAINNIVKRMRNIMRQDAGLNGDAQRIETMTWMFFLKVYDAQEEEWEMKAFQNNAQYQSVIPEPLRWRNWAVDNRDGEAITGDNLLAFINNVLFAVFKGKDVEYEGETIKGLVVKADTPRSKSIVFETFTDLNQYMKNGILLRQMINIVDEIDFADAQDRHLFGDIYEGILKDLQSAGSAGEFYTPRALTDFIVKMLDVRIGETFADFTSGTGGFLTSCLNYVKPQVKSAHDHELMQKMVRGQEWKPLPYLLSITNLLVHDIESPDIRHCDSLGRNISDFTDADRVDVIAMNPPYGGSTDASTKSNFPMKYRSSETADLFIALIMYRLKAGGRCGVIIPDTFLQGCDSADIALKEDLLRKFNLHTIIRLPGSIFAPYTSINTNILFFNNETAPGAPEGFRTCETWFYRLDMPEGYKHFSKKKQMKIEHLEECEKWWNNREEIIWDSGDKCRKFTPKELIEKNLNFDQCKFPKEEIEIKPIKEVIGDYAVKAIIHKENIVSALENVELLLDERKPKDITKTISQLCLYANQLSKLPMLLKKSILKEAIQGNLVCRIESEKTASELFTQIMKGKEYFAKEGIINKKKLTVKKIDDVDIPFQIPNHWKWCRFEDIASCRVGKTPARGDSSYWCKPIYPWVSISDMTDYGHVKNTKERISEKAKQIMREISPKGSLIMSFKLTVGRTSILDIDAYHNEAIITITPYYDESNILRNYLFLILPLIAQNGNKLDAIKGQTLNSDSIASLLIPLPPLSEQKRITDKIETLSKTIDSTL